MNTVDDGGAAFARPSSEHPLRDEWHPAQRGMTLRDYFAAKLMVAASEDNSPMQAARIAYEYADAMLEQRQKLYEREINGIGK